MKDRAHGFAQTNLQLYNQLIAAGGEAAELARVRAAYEFAAELLAGARRPSGKTFLAHLVGTASILAAHAAPPPLVCAGLLHAIYTHGRLGGRAKPPEDTRRAQVRERVGAEVEELIARYKSLAWNEATIPRIHGSVAQSDPIERQVLLLRLANELEDLLDLGMAYSPWSVYHELYRGPTGRLIAEIADRLDRPDMGSALREALRETLAAKVPEALQPS